MLSALWRVVRSSVRADGPSLAQRVAAVPRLVGASAAGTYQGLTRGRLALIAVALAYVVSPIDVVPEGLLLALGLVDDIAVATWIAGTLLVETDRFLAWERSAPTGTAAYVPGEVVDGALV